MKKRLSWILFCICISLIPGPSLASHEMMPFLDGRKGAVSITFEDGYPSQIRDAVPLLNAHNLKATFFAITESGWVNSHVVWSTFDQLARQGHEIGSHTVNHVDLTQLSDSELRWELNESQRVISQNVPSQSCVSLAYPEGLSNVSIRSAARESYIAAAGTWAPEGGFLNYYERGPAWEPVDFMNVGSYLVDGGTAMATLDEYLSLAEERRAWFSVHFNEDFQTEFLAQFLDHLAARDLWIDTFGSVARYMMERTTSTLSIVSETSSEIRLMLSHSLLDPSLTVPLTIRSTVPSHWAEVMVEQGNSISIVSTRIENQETVAYYDGVPNGGEIVLSNGTLKRAAVFVSNNPAKTLNPKEYVAKIDVASGSTEYFRPTYDTETDLAGWANPDALTFIGKRLFIAGISPGEKNQSRIWEIDRDTGREMTSFSPVAGRIKGLAGDGTNLFLLEAFEGKTRIHKFTSSGTHLYSFNVSQNLDGLAYGRDYLFGAYKNGVYRINPNSQAIVSAFTLPLKNVTGLDFLDGPIPFLLASVRRGETVYRIGLDQDLNFDGRIDAFCTAPKAKSSSVAMTYYR